MMKNLILFDNPTLRQKLWPLSATRPIAGFRIGIDTLTEKWEAILGLTASFLTENYLSKKFSCQYQSNNLYINSAYISSENLATEIIQLKLNEALIDGEELVAVFTNEHFTYPLNIDHTKINNKLISTSSIAIRQLSDIFIYNGKLLVADFQRITGSVSSTKIEDPFTVLYNEANIFIGKNANIKAAVLDASLGPIFIDENAKIEIGSLIQGPAYLGKNSILSLGSKIRPNTTIGPNCKIGGEVSKSVIFGNSNKSHDGFMGCSVIGEWCNWGAGTNNSNLKNDYGLVSMYDQSINGLASTGQLFAGTMMGDFCKTAIGTQFNTGTVIGVSSNIFQQGFPAKYIPSFTWGGSEEASQIYRLEKAIEVIKATMSRRNITISDAEIEILTYIFNN